MKLYRQKDHKGSKRVCSAGTFHGVHFPPCAFCKSDEPPFLGFCRLSRNNSGGWHFLCKAQVVLNSSMIAGCTIATVVAVGSMK